MIYCPVISFLQCIQHHLRKTLGRLLKLTYMLLATTTNIISLVSSCYMFRLYWPSRHIWYITFKNQNKMHIGLYFNLVTSHKFKKYMHVILSFKYDVSIGWGWSVQPNHVACTDVTNNICCGWQQCICWFWCTTMAWVLQKLLWCLLNGALKQFITYMTHNSYFNIWREKWTII